jgi:DNA-binding transcriptional ArsR family regulator
MKWLNNEDREEQGRHRLSRVVRVVAPAAAVGDVRLRQHLRSIARLTGGQLNTDRAVAPISFSTPSCAPCTPIINRPVDYPGSRDIVNQMVELHTPPLDPVFHALGDATRRRMLCELAQGERTVGQLAAPFAISLQAASKHIKVLEQAGLLRREVRGRTHLCWLEPGPLASAHEWLSFYEHFWTERLDVLERLLRQEDARKSSRKRR